MSLRYELKLVTSSSRLPQLRGLLQQHGETFRVHHASRQVNSIYFDTPNLGCYRANLLGDTNRHKLRLRWYGESANSEVSTAQLELKRKRNMLGDKKLFLLPDPIDLSQTWRQLRQSLLAQTPAPWHIQVNEASQAVTVTQYWREYWVSADGQIRVTLDYKQRAYDQQGYFRPNLRHALVIPDTLVIEIKADPIHSDRLEEIAGILPLQRTRHSKYVNSVIPTRY
jgi:hypothetical protein